MLYRPIANRTLRLKSSDAYQPSDTAICGPLGITAGTLRRVIISDVVCDAPVNDMPAIISGIPGHVIEDIGISNVYLVLGGAASVDRAATDPPEEEKDYPEPSRFGRLPAQALFVRHAKNIEVSNFAVASEAPDDRPVCWLSDVDGADFLAFKPPRIGRGPTFLLKDTRHFRVAASTPVPDTALDTTSLRALP